MSFFFFYWRESLQWPRDQAQFTWDLEHLWGDPAVPHSLASKWTSRKQLASLEDGESPVPEEPSQSGQILSFSKTKQKPQQNPKQFTQGGWRDWSPTPSHPAMLGEPASPSARSLTILPLPSSGSNEWETPVYQQRYAPDESFFTSIKLSRTPTLSQALCLCFVLASCVI